MDTQLQKLEASLAAAASPAEKLERLQEILYTRQSINDAKTTRYFHQMMRLAKAEGNILAQANALRYYSTGLVHAGETKKAKAYILKASALLAQINNRRFDGEIYRMLGIIDDSNGDFTSALHHYYLSLRFAEEKNDPLTLLTICLNLGSFFFARLNDHKKAAVYYLRTYALARSMKRWRVYAISCDYLAECYFALDNISKGKKYLDQGIKIAHRYQLPFVMLYLKATLARYHKKNNDHHATIRILEEVIQEATEHSDYNMVKVEILNITDSYLQLKQWKKAEQMLRRYEQLRKKFAFESGIRNLLSLKSELAKQKKEYPKAIRYLNQMLKMQEEDYKRDWQQKMNILEQSFTMENYKKDKEVAERVAQMRMDFLSNVSHEIRSPMNAVLGLTNILLQKNAANNNTSELQTIQASAQHLLNIVNDILDISKIDAGKLVVERTAVNIRDVLTTVQKTLSHKATEKKLSLSVHIESDVPPVIVGDSARITQILTNLVNNALKFTNKGKVEIALRCEGKARGKKVKLLFTVRDSGIGMSKEQRNNLFRRYEQAGVGTYRKFGGTGLGLHISKQLTELMGGKISVESTLGKGSVFSILLPVQVSSSQKTSLSHHDYTILHNKTFLLVEDNEEDMTVLEQTLRQCVGEELHILKATNGKEALRLMELYTKQSQANNIDIVLTDLSMPEMNGFDMAKKVKSLYPATRVIAVTAMLVTLDKKQLLQEGLDDVVSKPLNAEVLMKKICTVVQ